MPSKLLGFVYFVQADRLKRIKIGWTEDLRARLATLKTSSPVPLRPLGFMGGTRELEAEVHALFRDYRVIGEWFRPHPEVLDFIRESARPWPGPGPDRLGGIYRLHSQGGAIAWTAPYRVRCRLCSNVIPEESRGYRYSGPEGRGFDACEKCSLTRQGDIRRRFHF